MFGVPLELAVDPGLRFGAGQEARGEAHDLGIPEHVGDEVEICRDELAEDEPLCLSNDVHDFGLGLRWPAEK